MVCRLRQSYKRFWTPFLLATILDLFSHFNVHGLSTVVVPSLGKLHGLQDLTTTTTSTLKSDLSSNILVKFLTDQGFSSRAIVLQQSTSFPLLAEVYINGTAEIALLQNMTIKSGSASFHSIVQFSAQSLSSDQQYQQTIDLGQVTTFWNSVTNVDNNKDIKISSDDQKQFESSMADYNTFLDQIYYKRVGQGRNQVTHSKKGSLTKKSIGDFVATLEPEEREFADGLVRRLLKVGQGFLRIVDSQQLAKMIKHSLSTSSLNNHNKTGLTRDTQAAHILANDAKVGGRFKRWPSLLVATLSSSTSTTTTTTTTTLQDKDNTAVVIINGGWMIVDRSTRATSEGLKFAQRSIESTMVAANSNNNNINNKPHWTASDLRILRRLECLAMGELFTKQSIDGNNEKSVEIDVRQALTQLQLPCNPVGAQTALVQSGVWSNVKLQGRIEPWSKEVLEAASAYRKRVLESSINDNVKFDRKDLTNLPCLCIDPSSASFLDDAIGIRPRLSTNRWYNESVSKWEILLHISDVSDIYCENAEVRQNIHMAHHINILHNAAKGRGVSRYDLPSGPLHLLPPTVLDVLSLSSKDKDVHKCVTVWVYIDENTGKIADAGIERSLIRSPISISYSKCNRLFQNDNRNKLNVIEQQARILLLSVERIVSKWSDKKLSTSDAARRREERLQQKVLASKSYTYSNNKIDNKSVFDRSRGHLLIDNCLDLHSTVLLNMMRRAKAPLPISAGVAQSRGGRIASAPLRRYIDGQAQRQILAVLANYGKQMTLDECRDIASAASEARNAITNFKALRRN